MKAGEAEGGAAAPAAGGDVRRQPAERAGTPPRVLAAGMLGNLLEWYDFAVYGFLASVFAKNFFPQSSPSAALLSVFGVFAASFIVRPLGSVLFGHVGDRYGRRTALIASAGLMSVSTVAVGFLPTFETVGVLAPVLLLLLRLAQGLSIGGEYMTSAVYLAENAAVRWRGAVTSLVTAGCNGGMLLGSAIGALTAGLLTPEQLAAWGWRLPFLLGIALGGFAVLLRRAVALEPPIEAPAELPLVTAFREAWRTILRASLINFLLGVSYYLIFVYLSTWLQQVDGFSPGLALELNSASMLLVLVLCIVFAALSDRIGRKPLLIVGFFGLVVLSWPLFSLMRSGNDALALMGQMGFAVLIAVYGGPMPAALVEMFPRRIRCTAVGISWNLAIGIGGGTAPMVAVLLVAWTGSQMAPAFYLIAAAGIALAATLTLPETRGKPLD